MWNRWSPSRKLAAVVLLVTVVLAGAALASRGDGGSSAARSAVAASTSNGVNKGAESGGAGTTTGGTGSSAGGATTAGASTAPPTPLPVQATIGHTTGLHAGDEVTITVKADKGSLIYGVEMRMCRAGTVVHNDGDMLPTVTGQCASKPLSPGADGHKIVASEQPHDQVTTTYKVGTGTDTYKLDDATTNSVTCNSSHPCVLAVKYQIPNGFGFRTYPLAFS